MNPASPEFHNRAATSPALFNRCVLDWFGEWTNEALFQVGSEFTKNTDLDDHAYKVRVWPCFICACACVGVCVSVLCVSVFLCLSLCVPCQRAN